MTTARTIDLWTGLVFLALGVLGLFFTQNGVLFGFLPTNTTMQIVYLIVSALLLYGYFTTTQMAHSVSAVLGIIFVLLGVIGFFTASFLGLNVSSWNIVVNLVAGLVLVYDWLGTPERKTA